MDLMLPTLIFALIGGLAWIFFRSPESRRKLEYERRLKALLPAAAGFEPITKADRRSRTGAARLLHLLYDLNLTRKLEQAMWQAAIYAEVSEVLLICVLLFGAGAAASQSFLGSPWWSIAIGAALASLPILYIEFRRKRRLKAFVTQLPYALDLLRSSLEAGHTLGRGLQVVAEEFAEPLGGEFRAVVEQTRLGLPLPFALEDLFKRMPEEDLRLLVVAVKVQSAVGSSLAQIIGRLAEIVRTRQRLAAQVHAMTTQSRMSGMVVGLLPLLVIGVFSLVQPGYAHEIFHTAVGHKVLKVAAVLDGIAFVTIRRILKAEF